MTIQNGSRVAHGFGTHGTPSSVIGTIWDTKDVWIRPTFDYDGDAFEKAVLRIHFDEDPVVYLNGTKIAALSGYTTAYGQVDVTESFAGQFAKERTLSPPAVIKPMVGSISI